MTIREQRRIQARLRREHRERRLSVLRRHYEAMKREVGYAVTDRDYAYNNRDFELMRLLDVHLSEIGAVLELACENMMGGMM